MINRNIAIVGIIAIAACSAPVEDEETTVVRQEPIVGGWSAPAARYPWIASLWVSYTDIRCGGVLIAPNWVLTAAHCPEPFFVGIGPTSSTQIAISDRIQHPEYDKTAAMNDVALLRLSSAASATPLALNLDPGFPYAIDLASATIAKANASAAGWGATVEGGSFTFGLREVDLPVVTRASCQAALSDTGRLILDSHLCAGLSSGGRDTCNRDSGGPLIARSFGQDVLVGITSWGVGCARAGRPGVYQRMSEFVDWIAQNGIPIKTRSPAALTTTTALAIGM
jgi:trypsin